MTDIKDTVMGNNLPVETDIKIKTAIFNYIKRNNERVGLMIAVNIGADPNVYIGWSLCNKEDKFNIQGAFDLALFRAYSNKLAEAPHDGKNILTNEICEELMTVPSSIRKDMLKFQERINKYFKPKEQQNIPKFTFPDCMKKVELTEEDMKDIMKSFPQIAELFGGLRSDKDFFVRLF